MLLVITLFIIGVAPITITTRMLDILVGEHLFTSIISVIFQTEALVYAINYCKRNPQ